MLRVVGPQMLHERECSRCMKTIDAKLLFCPYCGSFKQDTCEKCQMAVEKDWKICGFCGSALRKPEMHEKSVVTGMRVCNND